MQKIMRYPSCDHWGLSSCISNLLNCNKIENTIVPVFSVVVLLCVDRRHLGDFGGPDTWQRREKAC